jgi:hypothetical protein
MEDLESLIFLGACALLAPTIQERGYVGARVRIGSAIELSRRVWAGLCQTDVNADLPED